MRTVVDMSEYTFACSTDEVAPGQYKSVNINQRNLLICNYLGEFFAIEDKCSHAAAKLNGGKFKNCLLHCPLHGAKFDIRDGSAQGKPAFTGIATFAIRCDGKDILVLVEAETAVEKYATMGSPFAPPPKP